MSFSKRFLKKMVSTVFAFNGFLFMGSDFIFQSSVSAHTVHTVTIKEVFKDLIRQINSNGGYTGTGMSFGFSNGEQYVYIPCGNGTSTIVPKRITDDISCEFNMYFHDLVLKYSSRPGAFVSSAPYTTPMPSPMQYPTQEQVVMPAPPPVQYSTPVTPTVVTPTPTLMQYSIPVIPKYIPPSADIL